MLYQVITDIRILHNGQTYVKGDVLELTAQEATRLGVFVKPIADTQQQDNTPPKAPQTDMDPPADTEEDDPPKTEDDPPADSEEDDLPKTEDTPPAEREGRTTRRHKRS